MKGMLPVSLNWRERCYVDIYEAPVEWMNGFSLVTINNEKFKTVKEIDYDLTNLLVWRELPLTSAQRKLDRFNEPLPN